MTKPSIEEARDPDLRGSLAALRRAARRARDLARRTGTGVVIWRNNRVEYLQPEDSAAPATVRDETEPYRGE